MWYSTKNLRTCDSFVCTCYFECFIRWAHLPEFHFRILDVGVLTFPLACVYEGHVEVCEVHCSDAEAQYTLKCFFNVVCLFLTTQRFYFRVYNKEKENRIPKACQHPHVHRTIVSL